MAKENKIIRINLHYGYVIDVEPLCYTLKKLYAGKTKDGEAKEQEKICGYFGNMRDLIEKYMFLAHIEKGASESVSMAEYVNMVDQSNKNAVRGLQSVLERYAVK